MEPNPREITGLYSRSSGKRSKAKRAAPGAGAAVDDNYTGSLSSIARMDVQPGVQVREYPNTKGSQQRGPGRGGNRPGIARSGGDYSASRAALNIKGKDGKTVAVESSAK